jgi:hypothetical protein
MSTQFLRKASLIVSGRKGNNPSAYDAGTGLDLSELHFRFTTSQQDVESPSSCSIRIYNLSEETIRQVRGEYDRVTLQAGYEDSYGVIFDGTIKQFRMGRENATDTYLDILAADGDLGYNFAVVNKTLAAGSTPQQRLNAAVEPMQEYGVKLGYVGPMTGGILPRGKVLFGMARAAIRAETQSQGMSWSIQGGAVQAIPLDGYLPGEAVVLSALTGLVGIPEQTVDGLKVRCLLNPRLRVGGLLQIDNAAVNQLVQQNPDAAPIPYNQWTGLQLLAKTTSDGVYRILVLEYEGDTRGQAFYCNVVCLAVDATTKKVKPYG